MKTSLSVTDTARNFSEIISRVAYKGERFILIKGKKAVAEISPVRNGRPLSELKGVLEALPPLSPAEINEFVDDLEAVRGHETETSGVKNPWEF